MLIASTPVDTGRKLNVHKTLNLRPFSTGKRFMGDAIRQYIYKLSGKSNKVQGNDNFSEPARQRSS